MGLYDDFRDGKRIGQVKLYDCSLAVFNIGDEVPDDVTPTTYSIAMREGGFVNITDRIFTSWTDVPQNNPIFDKWGGLYSDETHGMLVDEDYFYEGYPV